MRLDQDEIVEMMEQLKKEDVIRFTIPEIFGGGVAVSRIESQSSWKGTKEIYPEGWK